jgi:glycosyltransferase involved in cell wall biosynthesis
VTASFQSESSQSGAREPTAPAAEPVRPGIFLMTNTLETGGTERQFVTMAKALDRNRFSVTLGCLRKIGPFVSEVGELTEFPPGGSLFGFQSWSSRLNLSRFLRQNGIAVAHSFDFYSNLMLIPAARFTGVPVVVGSHRQLGDLLTPGKFRVQIGVFRFCDRVVCNSQAAAQRLRESGIREKKITVIPNGLPCDVFAAVPPALVREPGVVRIGMISRMNHAVKRHDLFLRAAAHLLPRFPKVRFLLVGDGPLRPSLEELVRQLGLGHRVSFLGDRRDVTAVLASLDITVLPSISESLSNVILESMAAGVPVVAAEVGGNVELVQHGSTGFLVPQGNDPKADEVQFAAAMETLVTQPELRSRFGLCAREKAQATYTISKVRDRYQDLYRNVLAEKGWMSTPPVERLQTVGPGTERL